MKPSLSVIVLSYNTKAYLESCLRSVRQSKGFDNKVEVVVVDNNSSDGSVEMVRNKFTQVKLIENKENLGFAAGNNVGIKVANGKYLLLLNSDTKVDPDTLALMLANIKADENIGAATCRLELTDGEMDPACHRGFPTPWNAFSYLIGLERLFPRSELFGGYHQRWKDLAKPHQVDVISGAFFMIPRRVVDEVGWLDERFFMYGEDIDWCYRIRKAGYKIMYYPNAKTIHYKKQSGRSKRNNVELRRETQHYFISTMDQFYRKHYVSEYQKPVTWLVLLLIRLMEVWL